MVVDWTSVGAGECVVFDLKEHGLVESNLSVRIRCRPVFPTSSKGVSFSDKCTAKCGHSYHSECFDEEEEEDVCIACSNDLKRPRGKRWAVEQHTTYAGTNVDVSGVYHVTATLVLESRLKKSKLFVTEPSPHTLAPAPGTTSTPVARPFKIRAEIIDYGDDEEEEEEEDKAAQKIKEAEARVRRIIEEGAREANEVMVRTEKAKADAAERDQASGCRRIQKEPSLYFNWLKRCL